MKPEKKPARAITEDQRQQVIELKHRLPTWGAQRLKRDCDLTLGEKAIRRIWHQANLLKRKRRKPRTKAGCSLLRLPGNAR